MRKLVVLFFALSALSFISCGDKTTKNDKAPADSVAVAPADTTVYGTCGDGTTMNYLELATSDNDTLRYRIDSDSLYSPVKGGMMSGDRIAVTGHQDGEEFVADKIINLTTLLGKWSSIDKNFEIQEGGIVKAVITENNKYVRWEINNGRLVLSPDTFDIYELGPDSLMLENAEGIFVYARIKK